jgi:hypothetical protein
VLLTRLPLMVSEETSSLDLHALSAPLAFILSHDQTLRLIRFLTHSSFGFFFVLLALCCSASCYYSAVKVLAPVFPTVKPMFRALSALLIGPGNLLKPLLRSLATIYCPEVALSIPYALPVSSLSRTFVRP